MLALALSGVTKRWPTTRYSRPPETSLCDLVIRLRRWAEADWSLLVRLNAPEMTEHVGGPETDDALRRRRERYLAAAYSETESVFCFTAVLEPDGVAVGKRQPLGTRVAGRAGLRDGLGRAAPTVRCGESPSRELFGSSPMG